MLVKYALRSLVNGLITIGVLLVIVFFAMHLLGDPVSIMVAPGASEEVIQARMREFGLDRPLLTQFASFLRDAARLDFGESVWLGEPALEVVFERLGRTAVLAVTSMTVAAVGGVALGVLCAVYENRWVDRVMGALTMAAAASVDFWVALVFILVGAVWLGILPTSGFGYGLQLVMPTLALALRPLGRIAQVTRPAMVSALHEDYVLSLGARGVSRRRAVLVHAGRNALSAIVTMAGWEFARLFTGTAVVIESIYAWPGIGKLAVDALLQRDYPLIIAVTLIGALAVVVVHIAVDLIYAAIDPRIRYHHG